MNKKNPTESSLAELLDDCAKDFDRKQNEVSERLVKSNCSSCRYAKVCNPKKGAKGFVFYDNQRKIYFHCSKRKPRKTPIPFEETRIYKMAYKKEKTNDQKAKRRD